MPGLRQAGGAGLAPVLLGTLRRRRPAALARRRLCGAGRRGRGNGRRRKALKCGARAGQAQASPLYSRSDAPRLAARPDAQVAQLVEHATENRSVGGSIPPLGTIPFNELASLPSGTLFVLAPGRFVHLRPPRPFVSYSHVDQPHMDWVLALAERLSANGVHLDQWDLTL